MAIEPNFEDFQSQDPMRCVKGLCYWQVLEILTSQPTAKITIWVLRISNITRLQIDWDVFQLEPHRSKNLFFFYSLWKSSKRHVERSHKISQNEAFCLWFQIFLWASNADRMFASSTKKQKLVVSITQPNLNRPKKQRFVLEDFTRFSQNVIFNFSPRNRRKSKKMDPLGSKWKLS